MNYRYLGRSGLQVSELSYGAWVSFSTQIGEDQALACMEAAFSAGVNYFDNAEVYAEGEAERMMGRVFERAGWKRKDLVVSTKIFWGGDGANDKGLSRTGATRPEQVEQNLKTPEVSAKLTPEVLERIEEIVGNRPKGPRALREG